MTSHLAELQVTGLPLLLPLLLCFYITQLLEELPASCQGQLLNKPISLFFFPGERRLSS